jgi:hypothetical protein
MSIHIRTLRSHLEMLQQTFSNALTSDSPFAKQPPHITSPLRLHQLTILDAMKIKEETLRTGYKIPDTEETLFSNYAFLGDRVGVGKTLMVLGHISQMSALPMQPLAVLSNLHPQSTSACFSIGPMQPTNNLYTSLVVVPHTIYKQWETAIRTQTTLQAHFLKTQRDLDKDSLLNSLKTSPLTLVSNTLLPVFLNSLKAREIHNPMWQRVFFDEADSIKIPSTCLVPSAIMTWYITASFSNLLFLNQFIYSHYLRQLPEEFLESLHPEIQDMVEREIDTQNPTNRVIFFRSQSQGYFQDRMKSLHPLRSHLILLNSKAFLDESIQLPPLYREFIRCRTPTSQQILESVLPPETESMLNAGDIQGALMSLGVAAHTPITVVDAVVGYRQKELDRLKRLYEYKKEEEYSTPQAKATALQALGSKVQTLESQISTLKTRMETSSKENCTICYEPPTDPVLVNCCNRRFCGRCILSWMVRSSSCPLCRGSIHPSSLVSISDHTQHTPLTQTPGLLPKKMEALLDILQKNPDGRFLLFSRHDVASLVEELAMHGHPVDFLQGNKDTVAKTLESFAKGQTKLLFLNSRTSAAGIHIPSATHVILLHRMGKEEEQQILGRAYRLGRTQPLHFVQLLNQRE